ncbi:unnamed protein product [Rotaria socialis]|uniref:Caspase family p20 domain-containing protein n=1 Tax=Rotaria socialis TaxID=392032 RepID=A0A820KNH1_9BILA|nr:unnamed protein product [Rotaria socialis]
MSRRRLALLFGNDNYGGDKQLNSCVKDARDMASKLNSVGFTCTQSHNSDKRGMDCAFRDFCSKIKNNDCILIYFSGHGMEQSGKNYLVPIEKVHDPEFDCVCLDTMLRQLNRCGDNILNVVILDACRADKDNNTWKTKGANAEECSEPAYGKALTSFVRLPTESQFALIFSSDPGTVSFGCKAGENSFFTSALLNHLVTPNLTLEEVMRNVQNEILERSSKRQRPWLNSCLREPFCFNGVQSPSSPGTRPPLAPPSTTRPGTAASSTTSGSTRPTTASSDVGACSKPAAVVNNKTNASIKCPHCSKLNVWKDATYIEGKVMTCAYEDCKRKFQHVSCPHCSGANIWRDANYKEGSAVTCATEKCKKKFQQVACPHCSGSNRWKNPTYAQGDIVTCTFENCKKKFQQVACPHCSCSITWRNATYTQGDIVTCARDTCKKTFQRMTCPHCSDMNLWRNATCKDGAVVTCGNENCKRKFQRVKCPHCSHSNAWKNADYKEGSIVTCANENCKRKFQRMTCPHCSRANIWKNADHEEGKPVTCVTDDVRRSNNKQSCAFRQLVVLNSKSYIELDEQEPLPANILTGAIETKEKAKKVSNDKFQIYYENHSCFDFDEDFVVLENPIIQNAITIIDQTSNNIENSKNSKCSKGDKISVKTPIDNIRRRLDDTIKKLDDSTLLNQQLITH